MTARPAFAGYDTANLRAVRALLACDIAATLAAGESPADSDLALYRAYTAALEDRTAADAAALTAEVGR